MKNKWFKITCLIFKCFIHLFIYLFSPITLFLDIVYTFVHVIVQVICTWTYVILYTFVLICTWMYVILYQNQKEKHTEWDPRIWSQCSFDVNYWSEFCHNITTIIPRHNITIVEKKRFLRTPEWINTWLNNS